MGGLTVCLVWSRWRSAAVAVLAGTLLTSGTSALQGQRRTTDFSPARQAPLWSRSDPDGTTLGTPNWLLVSDGRVYLTDYNGPAVVALDARSGAILWRYSKEGSGPGEFRHPGIVFWHPRGAAVIDNHTARLYLFSPDGALLAEQGVPRGLFFANGCSLADGSMILSAAAVMGPSLFVSSFGRPTADPFRFPFDTVRLHPNYRIMELASASGGAACFAARKLTGGMAMLSRSGPGTPQPFIESPKERPFKDPTQIRDTMDLPVPFALRAGATGSTAWVWFGGAKCAGKCIDFYSLPDLRYLHSIKLGRTGINMHNLDIDGDLVVMLGSRDDVPLVAAYRLPRPRAR
jgi:hypothetical protein